MKIYPGSWYFDNDILCLKKACEFREIADSSKGKIIVGRQSSEIINGAVYSASDPKIIDHYIELLYEFSSSKKHVHGWGETGPSFISSYCKNYPENVFIVDQSYFYPIDPSKTNYFYDPAFYKIGHDKIRDSKCIHIWSECLEMANIPLNMLPPKSSLLYYLLENSVNINDRFALPLETLYKLIYPPKFGLKKTIFNLIPALYDFLHKKLKILIDKV